MDVDMRRGLAEARMLTGTHWKPLLAYILLGVILPFLLLSSDPIFSMEAAAALIIAPESFQLRGSIAGPLYLLGICGAFVCGAMLALWNAMLADMREGYVAEIMYGMVAGAAYLIMGLAFYLALSFLLSLPVRFLGGADALQAWGMPFVIGRQIILTIVAAWLNARLCLIGPIMAATGKLEPLSAFAESWRRTASSQHRLFALYLAFNLMVALVVGLLAVLHTYLILDGEAARIGAMAMSFVWLIFWGAYFAIVTLVPAGLYRAAERGVPAEVFA